MFCHIVARVYENGEVDTKVVGLGILFFENRANLSNFRNSDPSKGKVLYPLSCIEARWIQYETMEKNKRSRAFARLQLIITLRNLFSACNGYGAVCEPVFHLPFPGTLCRVS